jgi:hypothetical protein
MTITDDKFTIAASARPLRVAYLLDPETCPHSLLDAIFKEAYGRWGGRRTLIVPAKQGGIDICYADWLFYYDADVICSFVPLTDDAVAAIHERYCPAHLVYRKPPEAPPGTDSYFRVESPLRSLCSLSIIPALLSRPWGLGERMTDLRCAHRLMATTCSN